MSQDTQNNELLSQNFLDSLKRIYEHYFDEEFAHYEQTGKPEEHIYWDLDQVSHFLDSVKQQQIQQSFKDDLDGIWG